MRTRRWRDHQDRMIENVLDRGGLMTLSIMGSLARHLVTPYYTITGATGAIMNVGGGGGGGGGNSSPRSGSRGRIESSGWSFNTRVEGGRGRPHT
ncbi:hypothetical protein CIB48_g7760 [Xylaria polymorpha]|nr:hypothetical protein CIB48_g7760 [Xylaria polymorpha]